jgi:hypothetical protein
MNDVDIIIYRYQNDYKYDFRLRNYAYFAKYTHVNVTEQSNKIRDTMKATSWKISSNNTTSNTKVIIKLLAFCLRKDHQKNEYTKQ